MEQGKINFRKLAAVHLCTVVLLLCTSCSSLDFSQFPGYHELFDSTEKMVIVKRRPAENLLTAGAPPLPQSAPATPVSAPTASNYDRPVYVNTKPQPAYRDPNDTSPPDFRNTFTTLNPIKSEQEGLYPGRFVSGEIPVSPYAPPLPERQVSPNAVPESQAFRYMTPPPPQAPAPPLPPGELPPSAFNSTAAPTIPVAQQPIQYRNSYSNNNDNGPFAPLPTRSSLDNLVPVVSPLSASNSPNYPGPGLDAQPIAPVNSPSSQLNPAGPTPLSPGAEANYPAPQAPVSPNARRAPSLNPQTKSQLQLVTGQSSPDAYPSIANVPAKQDYEAKRAELTTQMQDMIAERNRIAEQQRYYNDPVNVIHPNKPLRPDASLQPVTNPAPIAASTANPDSLNFGNINAAPDVSPSPGTGIPAANRNSVVPYTAPSPVKPVITQGEPTPAIPAAKERYLPDISPEIVNSNPALSPNNIPQTLPAPAPYTAPAAPLAPHVEEKDLAPIPAPASTPAPESSAAPFPSQPVILHDEPISDTPHAAREEHLPDMQSASTYPTPPHVDERDLAPAQAPVPAAATPNLPPYLMAPAKSAAPAISSSSDSSPTAPEPQTPVMPAPLALPPEQRSPAAPAAQINNSPLVTNPPVYNGPVAQPQGSGPRYLSGSRYLNREYRNQDCPLCIQN